MKKFVDWLTKPTLNHLDCILISLVCMFTITGSFWLAIWMLTWGTLISYLIGRRRQDKERENKDKAWQQAALHGDKITAIKIYRNLYGTDLKETLDIITTYKDNNGPVV